MLVLACAAVVILVAVDLHELVNRAR